MKELIIMMGAPGSGKSTWVKNFLTDAKYPDDYVYISRDEVRFNMVAEDENYFSKENAVYKEFTSLINKALAEGKSVIADQTSLTKKARAKLLNALTEKPSYIAVVYIKRPLDIILKYNAKRSGRQYVPEDAVINMYNSIEEPTKGEGIDAAVIIEHRRKTCIDLITGKTVVDNNYKEKTIR